MALAGQAAATYDWNAFYPVERAVMGASVSDDFILPWFYPPTFLLATAALAVLPCLWSCLAWLAVTGIGYVAAIRAILPHRPGVVLALAAPSELVNILMMESGFAIAGLTSTTLILMESRPVLAGVALGALTFKPQLGLLFPLVLVLTGRWRVVFSTAATTILLAVWPLSYLGPILGRPICTSGRRSAPFRSAAMLIIRGSRPGTRSRATWVPAP